MPLLKMTIFLHAIFYYLPLHAQSIKTGPILQEYSYTNPYLSSKYSDNYHKVTFFVDKRGNKKRKPVKFRSVGFILTKNDKTTGSGIILGKNCDVLVTANHTIEDRLGNTIDGSIKNQFVSQDISTTTNIFKSATFFKNKSSGFLKLVNNEQYPDRDWAVIKLQSPSKYACMKDLEINYDFKKKKCKGEYVLIGYHKDDMRTKYESYGSYFPMDFQGELAKDKNGGALFNMNPTHIGHHLSTTGASSGAPILCKYINNFNKTKYRLEGIHTDGVPDSKKDNKPIHSLYERSHAFNRALKITGDFANALRDALD